jgi:hypothetical protein
MYDLTTTATNRVVFGFWESVGAQDEYSGDLNNS